jgi:cell division protein FtsL
MAPHRMMRRWFPIAAILVILVLAVGLYKSKTDAEAARVRIAALKEQVAEARAEVQALRAEAAHLESPAHIEELARRNLDLKLGGAAQTRPENEMAEALPAPRNP